MPPETPAERSPLAARLCCASASVDITPALPVAMAGVESRTQAFRAVATPLEANALLLTASGERTLIVSADLLYFGPTLEAAVQRSAASLGIAHGHVVLLASHTHFAPATDASKPRLGMVDAGYMQFLELALADLVRAVGQAEPVPVHVEATRVAAGNLNINRRRRWPFPTLTRRGLNFGPNMVMAPAPAAPRDEYIDVLRFLDDSGAVCCVAWKFACHPVCYPDAQSVCAEFPGHARTRLRQRLGHPLPVLFMQGFTGDVRPALFGNRGWKDHMSALRRGPGFGEATMAQWSAWADNLGEALCQAVRAAPARRITAAPAVTCVDLPLSRLVEQGASPPDTARPMRLQRLAFGDELELLFLAAEPCSPYLAVFGAGERTWCIGYAGHVFGYLPAAHQVAEGGYEADGFFGMFGLAGRWCAGFEAAVVAAVQQLRRGAASGP